MGEIIIPREIKVPLTNLNKPFHSFVQLLTWTKKGKPIHSAGKSPIANFEGDLLKTIKDITPQSREILQTFVYVVRAHKKKKLWKS